MLYMFDLDGTLIEGFLDKKPREGHEWCDGEVYAEVTLLPDVRDRLRFIAQRDEQARFAICTNQAGVAYGYQTENDVRVKLGMVLAKLEFFWSRPVSVHVCFNHPEAPWMFGKIINPYKLNDACRKPGPGMLEEAIKWHGVFDTAVVFVGDMDTDKEAASAAGVPYIDHSIFFRNEMCDHCGGSMFLAGSTYVCASCGANLGLR